MSYCRLQMKDHRYEETVDNAEERSFMKEWTTPVIQMIPEEVMLVICHTKNTFDKRRLLETQNPTMKKTALKIRRFIREKKVADFFAGLKADFAEEATVAAAATAPLEVDAREINPLLEFAASPAPCADGCGHGHAAAEAETAPTLEVTEV